MAARKIAATDQPGEVQRAPATLIYVPGLGHDVNNTAEVIAESIAKNADRYRGAVTASHDDVPPATPGLRAVATIKAGKTPLLDVTELDYREALEGLARNEKADGGSEGVTPSLIRQTYYALWGTQKWLAALVRRKNDSQRKGTDETNSKSPMAKFQLLIGLALLLVLTGALAIGLVGVAMTVFTQLGWDAVVPDWLVDPAPWLALTGGLVSAGTLAKWRTALLRGAKRTEQYLRYFGDSRDRDTVIYPVTDAVDKLREAGYAGDIHILAYSFGSIVTLDAFATDSRSPWQPKGVDGATSIVTVGSPLDFVNLYFPGHFTAQQARRPELPWANVFIPSDVFGSNFHAGHDHDASDTEVMNWQVANHVFRPRDKLTFWGVLFRSVGLTRHNLYWDRNGGCWMPPLLHQWGLIRTPARAATKMPGPTAAPDAAAAAAGGSNIRAVPAPKPVAAAAARKTTRPKPVTAAANILPDGSAKTREKKPAANNVTAITSRSKKTTTAKPASKPEATSTRPKKSAAAKTTPKRPAGKTAPKPAASSTRPKRATTARDRSKPGATSTRPKKIAAVKTAPSRSASKSAAKTTTAKTTARKRATAKPADADATPKRPPGKTTIAKTAAKSSLPKKPTTARDRSKPAIKTPRKRAATARKTSASKTAAKTTARKRAANRPTTAKATNARPATKTTTAKATVRKRAAAKASQPKRPATKTIPRQRPAATANTRAKAGVAKKTHRKANSTATAGARRKSG
jgi:hypothetical protein